MPNSLDQLQAQLKSHKNTKGEIARQFKTIVKNSAEHQALLEQMKAISHLIDQTEAAIKAVTSTEEKNANTTATNSSEEHPKEAFDFLEPQQHWPDDIHIQIANTEQLTLWQTYLQQHPHTPYHQQDWSNLIEQEFGHPSLVLIALNPQHDIIGGLPLTLFSSKLFGRFAVSIPFINYGGAITEYKNISQALIHHSKKLLAEYQLSHIEIRSVQADLYPLFTAKKASMILRLPSDNETLEKSLGAKLRAQYKKAEEYSPELTIGKLELLDDFYQVFARNMRDLGTPVYPKHFFRAILNNAAIKSTLIIVKLQGKPVSAAFLIGNGDTLEIPWASTITAANKLNMNMWMYRNILQFAIENQFAFFDFGRSTIDAGTYKFKKQWGAAPRQHYWYYLMPEGQALPEINPNNPKYKMVIALWKLMPVWLTKILGPLLIKHIP